MSLIVEGGDPYALVDGLYLQEFDMDQNLVFEWTSWDHINITDNLLVDLTAPLIDFIHANAIAIDHDNNILLSFRSLNEIIKIDRTTGNIMWRLGGSKNEFDFINDPLNGFNMQHNIQVLENGNITIFDNGLLHDTPTTRVVEYQLNEIDKNALLVWDYEHPNQYKSIAMGSAQRLPNGNTLINWGLIVNGQPATITEVTQDKNIVLEIHYPIGNNCYKVTKKDWDFSINQIAGDLNLDDTINILDCVALVDYILKHKQSHSIFHLFKSDLNKDSDINIIDIVLIINLILDD